MIGRYTSIPNDLSAEETLDILHNTHALCY